MGEINTKLPLLLNRIGNSIYAEALCEHQSTCQVLEETAIEMYIGADCKNIADAVISCDSM